MSPNRRVPRRKGPKTAKPSGESKRRKRRSNNRINVWVLSAVMLTGGCVKRALTIKTEPAGAQVYVNEQLKGESPVTFDPVWYGWQRVTVKKDGYARVDDKRMLRAPAYLWIPFDLAMELLPFTIKHEREWSYTLAEAQGPAIPQAPDRRSLLPLSGSEPVAVADEPKIWPTWREVSPEEALGIGRWTVPKNAPKTKPAPQQSRLDRARYALGHDPELVEELHTTFGVAPAQGKEIRVSALVQPLQKEMLDGDRSAQANSDGK